MIFAAIRKGGQEGSGRNAAYRQTAPSRRPLCHQEFEGSDRNLDLRRYGDCADPRIAVYKTAEENVKKLAMPETPFWKPY